MMSECQHQWEMVNIRFGFVVFEKCYHCRGLRTYFTREGVPILGDKYREGDHFWNRVENAQSFRFDLICRKCKDAESFDDLMGLMYCTGCLPDCRVEVLRKKLEAERVHILLACGFLSESDPKPKQIPARKLTKLTDYFNQRRVMARSLMSIIPFDLEDGFSRCKGEFLHDVGMLSQEPLKERTSPF